MTENVQTPDGDFGPRFLAALGAEIPRPIGEKFLFHARLLLEVNQTHNLTAILEPAALARKLYFPSWKFGQILGLTRERVLDLGSGGGFPGIPMAISNPEASLTLAEATRKKAEFLERAIRETALNNSRALAERGEAFLVQNRVDWIVAQAVGPVSRILTILAPVQGSFRMLGLMKGSNWTKEIDEAELRRHGYMPPKVVPYLIPSFEDQPEENRVALILRPRTR